MLGRLGQSHFTVLPATADNATEVPRDQGGTPGFDVRLVGKDLLVTEVDADGGGAAAGVRTGWKLRSIDGALVSTLLASLPETLEPRLLQVEAWRLAHLRLRGPSGSPAAVSFEDGSGAVVQMSVDRRLESGQPVTVGNLPTMFVRVRSHRAETPAGRPAGVIGFNVWMTAVDPLFQKAVDEFRQRDGIVIDLRGNPGGLAAMLMGISGHFIDERKAARRDEDARQRAAVRGQSAAGQRARASACSPSPARSRSWSMR